MMVQCRYPPNVCQMLVKTDPGPEAGPTLAPNAPKPFVPNAPPLYKKKMFASVSSVMFVVVRTESIRFLARNGPLRPLRGGGRV